MVTQTDKSFLMDLRFAVSLNRLEGVDESMGTTWYVSGSMDANAKLTLEQY
jgi:hypothetical protein